MAWDDATNDGDDVTQDFYDILKNFFFGYRILTAAAWHNHILSLYMLSQILTQLLSLLCGGLEEKIKV